MEPMTRATSTKCKGVRASEAARFSARQSSMDHEDVVNLKTAGMFFWNPKTPAAVTHAPTVRRWVWLYCLSKGCTGWEARATALFGCPAGMPT